MIVLAFYDKRKFKAQLDFLEYEHSKGNYLPWEPDKDCTTYVIIDSIELSVLYTNKDLFHKVKEVLSALAEEAEFGMSFYNVTRPVQIKRYLNGKPKGKPKSKVVHFDKFSSLFKVIRICVYENYVANIINK